MDNIDEIISLCNPKLNNNGLIVFEMEKNSKYQEEYENLYLIKDKTYGIKKVIIYEKEV